MPGFIVTNTRYDQSLYVKYPRLCKEYSIENSKYTIRGNLLNKFEEHRIFFDSENFSAISDGIVLNYKEIVDKNLSTTIENMLLQYDKNTVFSSLRGNSAGAIYSKKNDTWTFYTGHFEDKPIYYYFSDAKWAVSSNVNYIYDWMHYENIKVENNEDAYYNLLTYGYMIDTDTLVNNVKKLSYGSYIELENNQFIIKKYFDLEDIQENTNLILNDVVDKLENLFNQAIQREFDVDTFYGLKHILTLSGGYDSRMVLSAAKNLNYNHILNITFSKTDYLDETIAKQVAHLFDEEIMIKSLDDANYVLNGKNIVDCTGGLTFYLGSAHTMSMVETINFENYGILHMGQELILKPYIGLSEKDLAVKPGMKRYSEFIQMIKPLKEKYVSFEQFCIRTRGFKGNLCSQLPIYEVSEVYSAFMDVDFFKFVLTIPFELRDTIKPYDDWVLKYHQKAASIKVESTYGKIGENVFWKKYHKFQKTGLKNTFIWLLRKFGLKIEFDRSEYKFTMNPYDYWYDNKEKLQAGMKNQFQILFEQSKLSDALKQEIKNMFENGRAFDKALVLTALYGEKNARERNTK